MGQRPGGDPVVLLGVDESPVGTERDLRNEVTRFPKRVGSLKVVLPMSLVRGFTGAGRPPGEGNRRDEPKGKVMLGRIGDDRYVPYTLYGRLMQWVFPPSSTKNYVERRAGRAGLFRPFLHGRDHVIATRPAPC